MQVLVDSKLARICLLTTQANPEYLFSSDCYIRSPRTFCDTALACANMAVPDWASI